MKDVLAEVLSVTTDILSIRGFVEREPVTDLRPGLFGQEDRIGVIKDKSKVKEKLMFSK